jgi:hypothetical protein
MKIKFGEFMTNENYEYECDHELLEYPLLDNSGNILYWMCRCGYRKEAGFSEDEGSYDDEDFAD